MGRRKAAKHYPLMPWESANLDCKEGRYIRVGNSLLLSKAFQALAPSAQILYLALAMEGGGKPSVKLSHSAAKKYGVPPTTFDRSIKALREAGFIELVEDENHAQFAANVYRFSYSWKSRSP